MKSLSIALAFAALVDAAAQTHAGSLDTISVDGETHVATIHAEGAQIYECKPNASGTLAWQFREPIASLIENGKTIGRHYAGPHWELADSSAVAGKAVARIGGATPNDIPLLKLEVTKRSGYGLLSGITSIQRINTHGGVAEGSCTESGLVLSVPYSADYAFYRKE